LTKNNIYLFTCKTFILKIVAKSRIEKTNLPNNST